MNLMLRAGHVLREKVQRVSIEWLKENLLTLFYIGLLVESHQYEIGIKSNRKSERFDEYLLSPVIYRPSRAGRIQFVKAYNLTLKFKAVRKEKNGYVY